MRWLLYGLAALGPVALAIVLFVIFTGGTSSSSGGGATGSLGPAVDFSKLPGIRTGPAPWDPGYNGLPDRLKPLGLDALPAEALKLHIHEYLYIFVDGKQIKVPDNIGIYDGDFITELHTHPGESGFIHVEAPKEQTYSLGQFFGVWGVRLSKNCIGGYCGTPSKPLRIYVNGKLFKGPDPTRIGLHAHDVFAIVYGKPPKKIPSKHDFSAVG